MTEETKLLTGPYFQQESSSNILVLVDDTTTPVRLGKALKNAGGAGVLTIVDDGSGNLVFSPSTGNVVAGLAKSIVDVSVPGETNVAAIVSLNGDGITPDDAAFNAFQPYQKTIGKTFPGPVTVTIASPAVFTKVNHGLRVNEAVIFSTTGTLPTGITAGTSYFVLSAGLTLDVFQVSTHNPYPAFDGEGSAINTSGSQSGIHSMQIQGADWQNIRLPPGNYILTAHHDAGGNQRRSRWLCHGAAVGPAFGAPSADLSFSGRGAGWNYAGAQGVQASIQTANAGDTKLFLANIVDASKFQIGGMLLLMCLDLQDPYGAVESTPANNHYFEYCRITAINSGTGQITVLTPLRYSYRSTYPLMVSQVGSLTGGPATAIPICSDWDMEVEVHGLRSGNHGSAMIANARICRYFDCVFDANGVIPSQNQTFIAERCKWGDTDYSLGSVEVDKLVDYACFIDCQGNDLEVQSSSVNTLVVERGNWGSITGSPHILNLNNMITPLVWVGPRFFGATDKVVIEGSTIGQIVPSQRLDDALAVGAFDNCVQNFTFSNGTLTIPIAATAANAWAVPGRGMYVNDMAGVNQNMGSPFNILDVYTTGVDPNKLFCIDTDLSSLPTITASFAATISNASPSIIHKVAHGLVAGTPFFLKTSGAFPSPVATNTLYYVRTAGLGADDFTYSLTAGGVGAAVNTTTAGSGTHTVFANPLHFQPLSCKDISVVGSTGCLDIEMLSIAPKHKPLYSYFKRTYIGGLSINEFLWVPNPKIYGKLVSMSINVTRAYTGAFGPFSLVFSATGFKDNLTAGNLSQTIDLATVGERVITQTAATGSVGTDTIAAYPYWIANPMTIQISGGGTAEAITKCPIVVVTIETDQGYSNPGDLVFQGPTQAHPIEITSTLPVGSFS